jgi:hypothetical protein
MITTVARIAGENMMIIECSSFRLSLHPMVRVNTFCLMRWDCLPTPFGLQIPFPSHILNRAYSIITDCRKVRIEPVTLL